MFLTKRVRPPKYFEGPYPTWSVQTGLFLSSVWQPPGVSPSWSSAETHGQGWSANRSLTWVPTCHIFQLKGYFCSKIPWNFLEESQTSEAPEIRLMSSLRVTRRPERHWRQGYRSADSMFVFYTVLPSTAEEDSVNLKVAHSTTWIIGFSSAGCFSFQKMCCMSYSIGDSWARLALPGYSKLKCWWGLQGLSNCSLGCNASRTTFEICRAIDAKSYASMRSVGDCSWPLVSLVFMWEYHEFC